MIKLKISLMAKWLRHSWWVWEIVVQKQEDSVPIMAKSFCDFKIGTLASAVPVAFC